MANNISTYLVNSLLAWMAGTAFPAAPANVYVGLYNGDPLAGGTEVTTQIRSAGRVVASLEAVSGSSDTTILNSADIDFGNSESTVNVTHIALFDAAASGNRLWQKSLGSTVAVQTGQGVKIATGELSLSGTQSST